ncbi:dihydrouridine synthase [Coraliomargarita sinensis]|uniref:tRNA-dihydrouridine synthase n=2 Tax=Coraliomargarita sinensis TaxID=2174842 RepID=A0A317ZHN5_9BACT|nr:dihydrouridine synthase [Coraliomargarita sinensis]
MCHVPCDRPVTALAPMQDVTTLPFMRLLGKYGAPDLLFTEYFRVHGHSRLEQHIMDSILHHGTGRPVFAQLIGESLPDLERTVEAIKTAGLPVAGIDLNMGCPAPKVYKKNVGGGLLRDPAKVDEILGCLRAAVQGNFTVKMRIGFEDDRNFDAILELIEKHDVDLLSLHARTVKEAYRSEVHYEYIKRAAERVPCPVLANGNITSVAKGQRVLDETGSAGLMIGRHCIRNPWIFRQLREHFAGEPIFEPTMSDVRQYVEDLFQATSHPDRQGRFHINHLKKFLNFVGLSVDTDGQFLHDMRRAKSKEGLDEICDRHLIDGGRATELFPAEPIKGLVARPNCETARGCSL